LIYLERRAQYGWDTYMSFIPKRPVFSFLSHLYHIISHERPMLRRLRTVLVDWGSIISIDVDFGENREFDAVINPSIVVNTGLR